MDKTVINDMRIVPDADYLVVESISKNKIVFELDVEDIKSLRETSEEWLIEKGVSLEIEEFKEKKKKKKRKKELNLLALITCDVCGEKTLIAEARISDDGLIGQCCWQEKETKINEIG